jgi:hypothetical protein
VGSNVLADEFGADAIGILFELEHLLDAKP